MLLRLDNDIQIALSKLAVRERRDARDQAVVLLGEALRERGLLQDNSAGAVVSGEAASPAFPHQPAEVTP
jgi:hypothetical protein